MLDRATKKQTKNRKLAGIVKKTTIVKNYNFFIAVLERKLILHHFFPVLKVHLLADV